ncbi:MAG TPA: hypothetical protein VIM58_02280, partial [Candidatus Methylacidiphilales bacterium]
HLHSSRLGEAITAYSQAFHARLDSLTATFLNRGLDPVTANDYALKAIGRAVQKQAYLQAYSDAFLTVGVVLLLSGTALFFLPKPQPMHGGAPAAH